MDVESRVKGSESSRREEKAYLILLVLFTLITMLCLGYGLWYAIEFADTGSFSDLARLLTSGFLFVMSWVAAVGLWLRWAYMEESRRIITELVRIQDVEGK